MIQTILYAVQLTYIPTEIKNCFTVNSSVELSRETNTVCVNFEPSSNVLCQDLPRGLNVSVTLSELADEVYDYVYDFNYSATRQFCFVCPECAGTTFFKSSYARVSLTSVAKTTSFTVGKIFRVQADYSKCFFESRFDPDEYYSQLAVEKHRLCFKAASTFRCTVLSKVYSVNSIKVSLQFSDREPLDFVYTGETVLNTYFTDAGAYPSSRPYSFHTVCFASADNIYNIFAFNNFTTSSLTFKLTDQNNIPHVLLSNTFNVFYPSQFSENEQFRIVAATEEFQLMNFIQPIDFVQQTQLQSFGVYDTLIKLMFLPQKYSDFENKAIQFVDTEETLNLTGPMNYICCSGTTNITKCQESIQQVRNMDLNLFNIQVQHFIIVNNQVQTVVQNSNLKMSLMCWKEVTAIMDQTGLLLNFSYYDVTNCMFNERLDLIVKINIENNTEHQEYQVTVKQINTSFSRLQSSLKFEFVDPALNDLLAHTKCVAIQACAMDNVTVLQELLIYNLTIVQDSHDMNSILAYNGILCVSSIIIGFVLVFVKNSCQKRSFKKEMKGKDVQLKEIQLQSEELT
ncbi:Conserved_hypothetical protein [Hexamita inflata]|uniref:Transmembrane protein n=1 Tax=Hexamita inflata TaxID=28002 RepID=A0AA86UUU1_9EUKA|nr:Conserved hypothetical protein [Hexamita inflata]